MQKKTALTFVKQPLINFLNQLSIHFEYQKTSKSLFREGRYFYDFYLPEYNCIIETHGEQHYRTSCGFFKNNKEVVDNDKLKEISFPKLECIGSYFIYSNIELNIANLPNLKIINDEFMCFNKKLKYLELPQIVKIGDNFLSVNPIISYFSAPHLEEIGDKFLENNKYLKVLELPNLKRVGDFFLDTNEFLEELYLPNIEEIGHYYLTNNRKLKKLEIPENMIEKLIKCRGILKNVLIKLKIYKKELILKK